MPINNPSSLFSKIPMSYNAGMPITSGRPPKSESRTAFGARLAALREAASLSQREVAIALGMAQPSYAAWERHPVALTSDQLQKLASILHCEAADFFTAENAERRKRGPTGKVKQTFEAVAALPRPSQKNILEVVDILLAGERRRLLDKEKAAAKAAKGEPEATNSTA
jgi:transcriptional regulator with XRE-family HTH domain